MTNIIQILMKKSVCLDIQIELDEKDRLTLNVKVEFLHQFNSILCVNLVYVLKDIMNYKKYEPNVLVIVKYEKIKQECVHNVIKHFTCLKGSVILIDKRAFENKKKIFFNDYVK